MVLFLTMGCGASIIPLRCPSGYNKDKFIKLLAIYDQLDDDGDHVLSKAETIRILSIYVKTKMNTMENKLIELDHTIDHKIITLQNDYDRKVKQLADLLLLDKKRAQEDNERQRDDINNEIDHITQMPTKDKLHQFKKELSIHVNSDLGFWHFFVNA